MHWNLRLTFQHSNKSSIIQLRALQVNEVALQKQSLLLTDLARQTVELNIFSRTQPTEYFGISFVPFTFEYLGNQLNMKVGQILLEFVCLLSNESIILFKPLFY